MKFVYSYNSFDGKRLPTPFEKKMALLSVYSLKKATNQKITFYGDLPAVQFFSDNKIPFDNMFSTKFEFNNQLYWNTGKIETYAIQTESFLHIDFDTVFFPGFTVPYADIVTEQTRTFEQTDELKKFEFSQNVPEKLICSGILGGTYNLAFYQLYENMVSQAKKMIGQPTFDELVSLEEYALTQIVNEHKLTVAEIDCRFYAHFQGPNKEERFGKIINQLFEMYL